jgi:hypothetical protein
MMKNPYPPEAGDKISDYMHAKNTPLIPPLPRGD